MNRILSVILTVTMLVTMLPSAVFAVESDGKYEAESAEEAGAAFGQETDNGTTVEEIPDKETGNEVDEVRNTVDSESMNGGSEEPEAEDDDHAEEPSEAADNAIENDDADASEVNKVTTLEAEGKDYVVTITYGDDAELPPDAEIRVEEVKAEDDPDIYDSYVAQAAEAVKSEVEDLSYVKLLDISIVDKDEKKVDLQGNVDVQIRLKDVKEAEDTTQVVHFAGEEEVPEVMETEVAGDTVAFETEGFSIYAVISDKTDDDYQNVQRLTVKFYEHTEAYYDGHLGQGVRPEQPWRTMYVKKTDLPENENDAEGKALFEQIIYEPGEPADTEGTSNEFAGWVMAVPESGAESGSGSETEPASVTPKNITDIREDIADLLTEGVDDSDTVCYYPVFHKTFRLYYEDDKGEVLNTVSRWTDDTSCTVAITEDYITDRENKVFLYWVEKDSTEDPQKHYIKDADGADDLEETITLTKPVTILVPCLADGYKVTYEENDSDGNPSDATYTPSKCYKQGDFPVKPEDPERDHFQFEGWFTAPDESGAEFEDWAGPNTEGKTAPTADFTLYAHWSLIKDGPADYKVEVYLEKVKEGDGYDLAGSFTVKGKVQIGQAIPVSEITRLTTLANAETDADAGKVADLIAVTDLGEGSHGFEYEGRYEIVYPDENNTADAFGNTVVKLYYIRAEMTVKLVTMVSTNENGSGLYFKIDESGTIRYYPLTATQDPRTNNWAYSYVNYIMTNDNETTKGNTINYGGTRYKVGSTETLITGKYGRHINWPGISDNPPETFNQINSNMKYNYHTLDNNKSLDSYAGKEFNDNEVCVYKVDGINTIVYNYYETEDDPTKFKFVGPTSTMFNRYNIYINIASLFEGFEPYQYGETNSTYTPPKTYSPAGSVFHTYETANEHIAEDWIDVKSDGLIRHGSHESHNNYLLVKYKRIEKNLVFKYKNDDGAWTDLGTTVKAKYGYTLNKYEDKFPAGSEVEKKVSGQVLEGWYLDPDFNIKADADTLSEMTMGADDIPLYAKTVTGEYHIRVFWNDGSGHEENFWLPNGSVLNLNDDKFLKENPGYSLVGYYKSCENGVYKDKWEFSDRVTKEDISYSYDGLGDSARAGYPEGNPYPDTLDDNDPTYFKTAGVLTLYARWYYENVGFKIRYVNPAAPGEEPEELSVDPYRYQAGRNVSLADAPNVSDWPDGVEPDKMRFEGWVLKGSASSVAPGTIITAEDTLADSTDPVYDPDLDK